MRAIVIKQYGGPEVLAIEERPEPTPESGQVVIEVKAFGLNHAEAYFRKGVWGDVAEITGIECVGIVKADPAGHFAPGQKVRALVGGMGRSIDGSYAELTRVPSTNVVAIETDLPWEELAAIPESYATAWTALIGILTLAKDQTVVIRGATFAFTLWRFSEWQNWVCGLKFGCCETHRPPLSDQGAPRRRRARGPSTRSLTLWTEARSLRVDVGSRRESLQILTCPVRSSPHPRPARSGP
jgi:hypothetical protein